VRRSYYRITGFSGLTGYVVNPANPEILSVVLLQDFRIFRDWQDIL
jgi:hypothetical protein